jgi:undecaprenyl-diphosphatase
LNLPTAIVLGVIQGLTELFPVSSSAHLVIWQNFLPDFRQPGAAFDVMLHLGTLSSVIFYFRADLWKMFKSIVPFLTPPDVSLQSNSSPATMRKTVFFLIMATIPASLFGLLFKEDIHRMFENAAAAAFLLIITGALLFLSDKTKNAQRNLRDMTLMDSMMIGLSQAVALMPGISRSGATIAAGIFLKINRQDAARFSFLLSIPAICGAVILEMPYLKEVSFADRFSYAAGFISAAFAGFLSLKLFFLIIREARLKYFAYYCWIFGFFTLLVKFIFF